MSSKPRTCNLTTPFENNHEYSWSEYPRPQFRRDSYISLCGEWELSVAAKGKETHLGGIIVPFPPESRISGIERQLSADEIYIYRKTALIPEAFDKGRILLHFGAADQFAEVFINGIPVGGHNGGYLPFSFDITKHVSYGENLIEVKITDRLDTDYPYGKQRRNRGGMWYTPISGLWQTVWLESVAEEYISDIKLTPSLDSINIRTTGGSAEKKISINTENGILEHCWTGDETTIKIPSPVLWTPENPYLYDFTLTDGTDEIKSYFALRTITIENRNNRNYICLNGKPYFFHGLLDQGYYSDGIYTPATPEGYLWDIKKMKELGFNMLRKHIKIEPELFYYYCDKYGMIVFQDMVNSGKYNFIIDTALPTAGLRRGISYTASKKRRTLFENGAKQTVSLLYNHPCVCYYTIFNEGWGQYDADGLYDMLKPLDPTRVWDSTSGWFTEKKSDVKSEHIYFKKINLKPSDRPLVLSEFGGYSCKIEGHSFNLDKNYGYKTFATTTELTEGIKQLYNDEIIPAIDKGLCAAVLTQVSDVEDETNGLVTYDRQVVKVEKDVMTEIAEKITDSFNNLF